METRIPLTRESRSLLELLEDLWNFTDSSMQEYTFQSQSDLRKVILLSMAGASQRIIRGILSGFRGGSVDGLDLLTRSLVEGLINIKYILEDDSQMRARAYVVHDYRDRLRSLRRLMPLLEGGVVPGMTRVTDANRYRDLQTQIQRELDENETTYGRDNLRWPSLQERARMSNCEELYATVYWLLSLDAHMTSRGLDRYMRESSNNNVTIETGQDLSRVEMHLRTATISHLALLNECNNQFGFPSREELDRFEIAQADD